MIHYIFNIDFYFIRNYKYIKNYYNNNYNNNYINI